MSENLLNWTRKIPIFPRFGSKFATIRAAPDWLLSRLVATLDLALHRVQDSPFPDRQSTLVGLPLMISEHKWSNQFVVDDESGERIQITNLQTSRARNP